MIETNALIEGTMLGLEDHGCASCWLHLKFVGSGQGFGGYALDEYQEDLKRRVGCGWGMEFILRILTTVGVDKWEDLKGKHLRVRHDQPGFGGKIIAIGHIIDDRWFDAVAFSNEAEAWREARP